MNLRKILELTEQDIDELEYHENRLRITLERVRAELNAKKHAAEEIRTLIEKERVN
jgi:chaperonin cofactor prefoldin